MRNHSLTSKKVNLVLTNIYFVIYRWKRTLKKILALSDTWRLLKGLNTLYPSVAFGRQLKDAFGAICTAYTELIANSNRSHSEATHTHNFSMQHSMRHLAAAMQRFSQNVANFFLAF